MGRLAVYAAGEVGCRKLSAPPPSPSARDRAGVGCSASILQVPLSPIPPRGLSASELQTGTVLRVLKVVSAARALKPSKTDVAQMSLPRSGSHTRGARHANCAAPCGRAAPKEAYKVDPAFGLLVETLAVTGAQFSMTARPISSDRPPQVHLLRAAA